MRNPELGKQMLDVHLGQMAYESRRRWPSIVEVEGYRIVEDRAYQGFDNDPSCHHYRFCGHIPEMWPEPRFWCRSITVERIADGTRGWAVGPQADAYKAAVNRIEKPLAWPRK